MCIYMYMYMYVYMYVSEMYMYKESVTLSKRLHPPTLATMYMHYRTLEYVNPVPFPCTNRKI